MALSVEQVREAIESDLDSEVLERLMTAAEEDVARRIGPDAENIDLYVDGDLSTLFLPYRVQRVIEVAEVDDSDGVTETLLLAADWKHGSVLTIVGVPSRTWSRRVRVRVEPIRGPVRDRVVLDLTRLYAEHRPVQGESYGNHSRTLRKLDEERDSILNTLDAGRGLGVA